MNKMRVLLSMGSQNRVWHRRHEGNAEPVNIWGVPASQSSSREMISRYKDSFTPTPSHHVFSLWYHNSASFLNTLSEACAVSSCSEHSASSLHSHTVISWLPSSANQHLLGWGPITNHNGTIVGPHCHQCLKFSPATLWKFYPK